MAFERFFDFFTLSVNDGQQLTIFFKSRKTYTSGWKFEKYVSRFPKQLVGQIMSLKKHYTIDVSV